MKKGFNVLFAKIPNFLLFNRASIYMKYITPHFTNKSSENEVKCGYFKRPLHNCF